MGLAMTSLNFGLEKVEDGNARQVLTAVTQVISENAFLAFRGKHVKLELGAGTYELPHYLGFVPRDSWITHVSVPTGTSTAVFNYGLFTKTHYSVTITVSVPGTVVSVRGFLGRMREEGI